MSGDADPSAPARAIAEPARARMLIALLDGRTATAGELAAAAGVAASTASEHLAVLVDAGLVAVERVGRQRRVRLAGPDVARALEALQAIAPTGRVRSLRESRASRQLREGRTCYDHLAGDLGLRLTDLLVRHRLLVEPLTVGEVQAPPDPFPVDGPAATLGLSGPRGRRAWARGCLDWTGRRPHVAGQLGAQVLDAVRRQGWIDPADGRAVRLTPTGRGQLDRLEAA